MRSVLTKIGNSKGVIIPAQFLKDCQLDGAVSLEVRDKTIIFSKLDQPRSGWEEAFAAKGNSQDELLIDDAVTNYFDESEWTW